MAADSGFHRHSRSTTNPMPNASRAIAFVTLGSTLRSSPHARYTVRFPRPRTKVSTPQVSLLGLGPFLIARSPRCSLTIKPAFSKPAQWTSTTYLSTPSSCSANIPMFSRPISAVSATSWLTNIKTPIMCRTKWCSCLARSITTCVWWAMGISVLSLARRFLLSADWFRWKMCVSATF